MENLVEQINKNFANKKELQKEELLRMNTKQPLLDIPEKIRTLNNNIKSLQKQL